MEGTICKTQLCQNDQRKQSKPKSCGPKAIQGKLTVVDNQQGPNPTNTNPIILAKCVPGQHQNPEDCSHQTQLIKQQRMQLSVSMPPISISQQRQSVPQSVRSNRRSYSEHSLASHKRIVSKAIQNQTNNIYILKQRLEGLQYQDQTETERLAFIKEKTEKGEPIKSHKGMSPKRIKNQIQKNLTNLRDTRNKITGAQSNLQYKQAILEKITQFERKNLSKAQLKDDKEYCTLKNQLKKYRSQMVPSCCQKGN